MHGSLFLVFPVALYCTKDDGSVFYDCCFVLMNQIQPTFLFDVCFPFGDIPKLSFLVIFVFFLWINP